MEFAAKPQCLLLFASNCGFAAKKQFFFVSSVPSVVNLPYLMDHCEAVRGSSVRVMSLTDS